MHHHPRDKDPSVMAALFGEIPANSEYFAIRYVEMKGRKVDSPTPPIRSEAHCFFFITGGEALISIGDETHYFRPGECAAIPAGQIFAIRYFDNFTGYMGGFNTEFLNSGNGGNPVLSFRILRQWGNNKVRFDTGHYPHICHVLERICAESREGKNRNILKAYLTALLTEIEAVQGQDDAGNANPGNDICNRFIEMVFTNRNHSVPLAEYAGKLNITKDYLHKIIRRHTDKTPLEWIMEAVILEAKILLKQTEKPVGEVSAQVGIEDPSYFSRLFRKETGTSPLSYRKAAKVRK